MEETGVKNLQEQALGPFRQSFNQRYEQWKKGGLLTIALQTMPKQIKKDDVLYRLVQLRCEREKNLNEETLDPMIEEIIKCPTTSFRITNTRTPTRTECNSLSQLNRGRLDDPKNGPSASIEDKALLLCKHRLLPFLV